MMELGKKCIVWWSCGYKLGSHVGQRNQNARMRIDVRKKRKNDLVNKIKTKDIVEI